MIKNHPYRKALSLEAVSEIPQKRETTYDAKVVDALVTIANRCREEAKGWWAVLDSNQ
jgi:HD-GYP domain-containing protein (c-di-GMP phosphodiesterase class II)